MVGIFDMKIVLFQLYFFKPLPILSMHLFEFISSGYNQPQVNHVKRVIFPNIRYNISVFGMDFFSD